MIIYKSTNLITGKCYIGQTIKTLNKRIYNHLLDVKYNYDNTYFHNAIRKYGEENFTWEILCECSSKDELDEKEIYYIKELNTIRPYGYNLTKGGGGISGCKLTDEQKMKMSESHKGKKHSDEVKKKMSDIKKGKNSLNNKNYEIIFPNGEIKIIHGLKLWCEEHNLNYNSCKSYSKLNKQYKGYKINLLPTE